MLIVCLVCAMALVVSCEQAVVIVSSVVLYTLRPAVEVCFEETIWLLAAIVGLRRLEQLYAMCRLILF